MANTYLTRTSSTPTNALKWTYSVWVKIAGIANDTFLLDFNTDGNNRSNIGFQESNDRFIVYEKVSGSTSQLLETTQVFRDNSGWYNLVASCDRTLATASDRTKIYVNGSRVTSFSTETQPTQNVTGIINTAVNTLIGKYSQSTLYFNGSLSHVHFIDGTAYDASYFGSTDSTTGEWEINTSPTLTYGNNGFFILKDGNSVNDQSGNANNFTVGGGTLTNTEDCPSNVFSTYNPLDNYYANSTFSNGNTTIVTNSANTTYNTSTLGIPPTMKCYWEAKFDTVQSANGEVGIVNTPTTGSAAGAYRLYYQTYGISVNDGGAIWSANANTGITLGTLSTSDIVCFAWDGVNQALYVRKNGDAWINSGDPTSGASKTGAVKSFSGTSLTMFPAVGDQSGSHAVGTSTNFGNGYFGTTAISSEGTNASGIGKFEYNVPAGYSGLSTKGLNL